MEPQLKYYKTKKIYKVHPTNSLLSSIDSNIWLNEIIVHIKFFDFISLESTCLFFRNLLKNMKEIKMNQFLLRNIIGLKQETEIQKILQGIENGLEFYIIYNTESDSSHNCCCVIKSLIEGITYIAKNSAEEFINSKGVGIFSIIEEDKEEEAYENTGRQKLKKCSYINCTENALLLLSNMGYTSNLKSKYILCKKHLDEKIQKSMLFRFKFWVQFYSSLYNYGYLDKDFWNLEILKENNFIEHIVYDSSIDSCDSMYCFKYNEKTKTILYDYDDIGIVGMKFVNFLFFYYEKYTSGDNNYLLFFQGYKIKQVIDDDNLCERLLDYKKSYTSINK